MAKTSLLRKAQKEYFKRKMGQAKRGIGTRKMRYGTFQERDFTYSFRQAWADSFD